MNINIIASESMRLVEEELNKIIKNKTNIQIIDMNKTTIDELVKEASYTSLFEDKKTIIAKNSLFLTSEKTKESDIELLTKYLDNPNEKNSIIFTCYSKLDMRKKIVKFIKEKFNINFIDKLNYNDLIKKSENLFLQDGYKINNLSLKYIIDSCLMNYDLIYNEIDKIKTYYNKPCTVELEDVKNIVSKNAVDNNFKFVDAVINKDKKQVLNILTDLELLKVEPLNLISLLAREYRFMHITKELYENNTNINDISKELNIQNWQTEKIIKSSFNYSFNKIEKNIKILKECDLQIKNVYFDKYTLLKVSLLEILN